MAETYIRKAKNLVKKVLGMNYNLIRSDFDEENSCKSLNELLEIHEELNNKKEYYEKMANLLIEKILIKLNRKQENTPNVETNNVQKIMDYIKLNCMKNINAKDIARVFSVEEPPKKK